MSGVPWFSALRLRLHNAFLPGCGGRQARPEPLSSGPGPADLWTKIQNQQSALAKLERKYIVVKGDLRARATEVERLRDLLRQWYEQPLCNRGFDLDRETSDVLRWAEKNAGSGPTGASPVLVKDAPLPPAEVGTAREILRLRGVIQEMERPFDTAEFNAMADALEEARMELAALRAQNSHSRPAE